MVWTIVVVLVALVILLIALYRRALNEAAALYALLMLTLLNDEVLVGQRTGLLNLVSNAKARNADELASKVHSAMCDHATKVKEAGATLLGVSGGLWNMYRNSPASPRGGATS